MLSANKGGVQELFKETAPAPGDLIPNTAHDIEYDVSLLDYDYAAKCTDVQELQRLFQILKSGREGNYPQLEEAFENRIEQLDPTYVRYNARPVPSELRHEASNDVEIWMRDIKQKDVALRKPIGAGAKAVAAAVPATRHTIKSEASTSTNIIATPQLSITSNTSTNSSRIKSGDYRAWDKFDVEAELEKIDLSKPSLTGSSDKDRFELNRASTVASASLSNKFMRGANSSVDVQTNEFLSDQEKWKGNECLKAQEFEDAIFYYTHSIQLCPRPNLYTNRSLAYLKMKNFDKAILDASTAILDFSTTITPDLTVKAYIRRGRGYMSQGKLKEAISDFDMGIDISNENKLVKEKQELLSLRTEAVRKMNEVYGGFETIHGDKASANTTSTAETKKNKMVIEEIDDSEDEEEEKEAQHPITRTKKIAIEEIEDDDDEEEMEEDEQYEKEGNGNAYVPLGFSSRLSGPVITEIIEEETEPSLTPSCTIKVPAAAKTSYEFEAVWKSRRRSNRLIEEWVPYLTQFEPVVLAKLCAGTGGGSGDADLLEDLFLVLANLLNDRIDFVAATLQNLTRYPRLRITLKMISHNSKQGLIELLRSVETLSFNPPNLSFFESL